MTDTMTPAAGGPRKARKPVPPAYYAIGAGVLAVGYFLYQRNKSKNAATAAAVSAASPTPGAVGADAGTAASSYGNAGDISALLPYLQNMQGQTSSSGASYVAPTGESYGPLGGGLNSGGSPSVIGSDGSTYLAIGDPRALINLKKSGQQIYYQPAPGLFMPWNAAAGKGLGSVPTFVRQS